MKFFTTTKFLKFQQTADTVAHLQKGIAGFAMKTRPSEQTSAAATSEINPELEEKIANITKLVQAELDDEKRRKRQQGVLVEEQVGGATLIQTCTPGSTVLLVGSHADQVEDSADIPKLLQDMARLESILAVTRRKFTGTSTSPWGVICH